MRFAGGLRGGGLGFGQRGALRGQVELTQGLGPNDAVVAIGAAFLSDGDAVRLAGPGESASVPAGAAR